MEAVTGRSRAPLGIGHDDPAIETPLNCLEEAARRLAPADDDDVIVNLVERVEDDVHAIGIELP